MIALAVALALAAGPPLPEHVYIKTFERQFTAKYDLALYNGRIWWKPATGGEWAQLPPAGLPVGKGFDTPRELDEISADGDNLVGVDQTGRIYYAKLDTLKWTAVWGPTFREGPLYLDLAAGERMAMSHRKMFFEDIDGNPHDIIVGVTTLYVLTHGGRRLEYSDPWLPPDKRHQICLPEHGQFRAAAVSASASTLFVVDAAGHAYTRLADFDTMGLDPVLRYGWERERRTSPLDDGVYSLPAHQWVRQPDVPQPAFAAITIVQTGSGNASRELRVASTDGYWKKAIGDPSWEKVTADVPPTHAPALNPASPDALLPAHTQVFTGTLDGAAVTLEDFAPDCAPATFVVNGARLPLYFLQDWEPGHTALTGALFAGGHDLPLFHGRPLVEVELELDGDKLRLVERFRPRALRLDVELTAQSSAVKSTTGSP